MDDTGWIHFEDDYFESKEGKNVSDDQKFNPVICNHKWFFREHETESAEYLQYQADYFYWNRDYNKAAALYEETLNKYFSNSPFMKRNLLESIARCHLKMGNFLEAKTLAEECLSLSYTVELKSSILDLLIMIYEAVEDLEKQKEAILHLISYHPLNYRFWRNLAQCISKFPQSSSEKSLNNLIEAACLIRVSAITSSIRNKSAFSTFEEAEERLKSMNLPENFVSTGKKFYSNDLTEENLTVEDPNDFSRSDGNSENAEGNPEYSNFSAQWFKWVYSFT